STLIGERPKVSPHRQKIRESMAEILGLPVEKVSLKATTVEKMGAIGRKEGIAVISTVLLGSVH
ncbi:MAG TPA: 2-C-methyl-D-erythritol 2,4-cyclodiphosphate synthase, partial [Leptospiraceae bacterium]|nr:2-C-methyl-D-erythritol 2,4-cyclodiphosphate synthase [Leptospiraceae bacterium]